MIRRALALGLLVALAATGAEAKAPTKISGRITTGTAGASLPVDLSITVVGLVETNEVFRLQVTPSAQGNWSAENFPESALRFFVAVVYKGVTYSRVLEQTGLEHPTIDLIIYEPTTNDDSVVSVLSDTITLLQGKEAGTIEVLQLLRVTNTSDRTFVGSASGTGPVAIVRVPVAQGGFDVLPTDEMNREGIAKTQEGIATTAPLLPGESTISYVYRVRASRTGWQLRREVFYPTAKTDILIGPALELRAGPGFSFAESKELGGKTYRRYRGKKLLPGAVLGVDIGYADTAGSGLWLGLVGIVAALIAVVIAAGVIRRRRRMNEVTEDKTATRASAVEQIALLDIEHEAGTISDEDYRGRRENMKSQIT